MSEPISYEAARKFPDGIIRFVTRFVDPNKTEIETHVAHPIDEDYAEWEAQYQTLVARGTGYEA